MHTPFSCTYRHKLDKGVFFYKELCMTHKLTMTKYIWVHQNCYRPASQVLLQEQYTIMTFRAVTELYTIMTFRAVTELYTCKATRTMTQAWPHEEQAPWPVGVASGGGCRVDPPLPQSSHHHHYQYRCLCPQPHWLRQEEHRKER